MMRYTIHAVAGAVVGLATCVPGQAVAQPPGFPDMSGFADVSANFTKPGPRGEGVFAAFATPDGFYCDVGGDGFRCEGRLPGVAGLPPFQVNGSCDTGIAQFTPGNPSATIAHSKTSCPGAPTGTTLNPGQKITIGGSTCGVASGGVTACIDKANGGHGFVLQPSGSFAF